MHGLRVDLDGHNAGHVQAPGAVLEIVEEPEVASADRGGGMEPHGNADAAATSVWRVTVATSAVCPQKLS